MTDKGRGGGRNGPVPQRHRSVQTQLVDDTREFTRHLHGRLDRINGHEDDAEQAGRDAASNRFDTHVHVLGTFERIEEGQDPGVGGRVAKPTERALDEGGNDAPVKAGNATIRINGPQGLGESRAVAILVIDLLSVGLVRIAGQQEWREC
jgi:hypothetical protein